MATTPSSSPEAVKLYPGRYKFACVASAAPAAITAGLWASDAGVHMGSYTLPYWIATAAASALYYAASFHTVKTKEFGGVTVIEKPALELGEGLVYAPYLLTNFSRFPRGLQQHQFPGEPEEISKLSDEEAGRMREHLLKPIRIATAGEDTDGDPDDPLNARLILEPTFTVSWQVEKQGFFELYINIPGRTYEQMMTNVIRLLRDTGEKALNIEISRRSAAKVTSEKEEIAQAVLDRLAVATATWGIRICEVNVLGLEPDHATNDAINGIARAKANAKGTIITAEAGAKATVVSARAEAERMEILGRAEGNALNEKAKASGIGAEIILATDAAKEIAKGDSKIIFGGNLIDAVKNLMGGTK